MRLGGRLSRGHHSQASAMLRCLLLRTLSEFGTGLTSSHVRLESAIGSKANITGDGTGMPCAVQCCTMGNSYSPS